MFSFFKFQISNSTYCVPLRRGAGRVCRARRQARGGVGGALVGRLYTFAFTLTHSLKPPGYFNHRDYQVKPRFQSLLFHMQLCTATHGDKAYALAEVAIENIITRWVGGVDAFAGASTWRSQPASKL
jgi:hypothetical protein